MVPLYWGSHDFSGGGRGGALAPLPPWKLANLPLESSHQPCLNGESVDTLQRLLPSQRFLDR
jgi:hypothetical protein